MNVPWVCYMPRPSWLGYAFRYAVFFGRDGKHIGRGLRLFFYCVGDCEALDEREEQVDFTLFMSENGRIKRLGITVYNNLL